MNWMEKLTTVMKTQLDSGLISLNINLREYVGALTGLTEEMDSMANANTARGTEEVSGHAP